MRWYVAGIIVAFVAAGTGLGFIIAGTTPDMAPVMIKVLFFLALFLVFWSSLAIAVLVLTRSLERSFLWGFFLAFLAMMVIVIRKLL